MLSFSVKDKELKAFLKKYDHLNDPKSPFMRRAMTRLGQNQLRFIKRRLMQGRGLKGRLKCYSRDYREYRQDHHRRVDAVDLNYTGSYWKSFGVRYSAKNGSVIMGPGIGKALKFHSELGIKHDTGAGRLPKREHWGFTPEDRKKHLRNFISDRKRELERIKGRGLV